MLDLSKEDLKSWSLEELENVRDAVGDDIIRDMLGGDSQQ